MRRKQILTLLAACCVCCMVAAQEQELYILHTNDTHSRIDPVPQSEPNLEIAGRGGFVRRATLIKQLRAQHPDLLLFDCGDFSQGSPYYNMFRGEVEVKLMNEMGYDAGTLGNHEFDLGLDNLARLIRLARFPFVCANYGVVGTVLEGLVKPYTVLERGDIRIGVFGLGPDLESLLPEKSYEGVIFENPIETAQRVADLLRNEEQCDLVVCLSHLGWKFGDFSDEALIAATRGIDIVLGGHSHTLFDKTLFYKNADGEEVPLQQMGRNGAYVGQMKVTMKKGEKK